MDREVTLQSRSGGYAAKRIVDVLASGVGCLAFAPLAAVVAGAIVLEDGGNVFFVQTRVGFRRTSFAIIKFRSMRGQRITWVGSWLRKTGLDELPQFLNVLRGNMSMVGPRPLTDADIERIGWNHADYDWRFSARPGITGLSQLLGGRSARASARLDRLYLRRQNPILDFRLLALSLAVNLLGKRRVRQWLM